MKQILYQYSFQSIPSASKPISSISCAIFSGVISEVYVTLARPDISDTRIVSTPGTFEIVFSILFTHEAHVIPPIFRAQFSTGPEPLKVIFSSFLENETELGTIGFTTGDFAGFRRFKNVANKLQGKNGGQPERVFYKIV